MNRSLRILAIMIAVFGVAMSPAQARTLRIFFIGNSFSNNARTYLPQLAKEGGHDLTIGTAEVGGCSLERHWKAVAASIANPADRAGMLYNGKTLRQAMGNTKWDVVTIQQYSGQSSNVGSYRPYARELLDYVKSLQPQAEVVFHQTWAYRSDSKAFGYLTSTVRARTQKEMFVNSRVAYRTMASELGIRVVPTGDAFWHVNSDPKWGYQADATFDFKKALQPALPDQTNSLHVGDRWKDGKLSSDSNHANAAGCYLGGLVVYSFLFNESPERLTYVPPGVDADFASYLRAVAWQTVQEAAREDSTLPVGRAAIPAPGAPSNPKGIPR